MASAWTVIIPVKPPEMGKSRLRAGPEIARAMALDTIEATLGCSMVDRVLVVTSDATLASLSGAEHVAESSTIGLGSAIDTGLAATRRMTYRAVLLGDLPSLRPQDLAEALLVARPHPSSFVADRDGSGTTLVTAAPGVLLRHAFGTNSAQRHRDLGLRGLHLQAGSTVRMDVDLPEHLLDHSRFGPRTVRALRDAHFDRQTD